MGQNRSDPFCNDFCYDLITKVTQSNRRKSLKDEGQLTFGIRAIKFEFKDMITSPLILVSSTASSKSFPTNSKKCKKNSTVHPLGPGLLSLVNPFKTSRTSSLVQGFSSICTSSSDTILGKVLPSRSAPQW
jgi:hypothetical protein